MDAESATGGPATEPERELPQSPKLLRAVTLFHEYERATRRWVSTAGVRLTSLVPGGLTLEFPPAPDDIGLLIGDCLQNLRSALDHEVYRQAAANKGRGWNRLDECQFPIYREEQAFDRANQKLIGGLHAHVRDFIRSIQVFAQPKDTVADPLHLLNRLARVDRHRLLHIAAAQPTQLNLLPLLPGAKAIETEMTVRVFFVDPDFMQIDTHQTLLNSINAVAWTIVRMRIQE
jgi:hypothetical protein